MSTEKQDLESNPLEGEDARNTFALNELQTSNQAKSIGAGTDETKKEQVAQVKMDKTAGSKKNKKGQLKKEQVLSDSVSRKDKTAVLKNGHALQTMHFLFSAAHLVPTTSMSQNLTSSAVRLREKHTGRFTPSLKRAMCARCKVVLVPGNTATVRIRSNKSGKFRVVSCLLCGWHKRFLLGNKELKIEQCPIFDCT